MKWDKQSDYHAISDCKRYTVAFYQCGDQKLYGITCGNEQIGYFKSKAAAQKAAEKHADKQEVTA